MSEDDRGRDEGSAGVPPGAVQGSGGASDAPASVGPTSAPTPRSLLKAVDLNKARLAPGAKPDSRHSPTVRRLAPPRPPTAAELAAWNEPGAMPLPASLPSAPPARPLLGIAIVGAMALGLALVGLWAARSRGASVAPVTSAQVASAALASAAVSAARPAASADTLAPAPPPLAPPKAGSLAPPSKRGATPELVE